MKRISLSDLMTTIFVLVDDWYQQFGTQSLQSKAGRKSEFADCEVISTCYQE